MALCDMIVNHDAVFRFRPLLAALRAHAAVGEAWRLELGEAMWRDMKDGFSAMPRALGVSTRAWDRFRAGALDWKAVFKRCGLPNSTLPGTREIRDMQRPWNRETYARYIRGAWEVKVGVVQPL